MSIPPAAAATPSPSQLVTPRMLWRRRLWRMLALFLVWYGIVVAGMSAFENLLVYLPTKYPTGNWTPPAGVEEVNFRSVDGTELHGWYFPHPKPQGVALFSHGNGGNVAGWAGAALGLRDRHQLSVFLYDYRGYGRSAGSPSETSILQDARAARQWLAQRAGVAEQEVVQFGQSLGGGVAVDLAAKDGARGLVLIRTFTSLPDVAATRFPWLPVRWIMRNRLDSLAKIANYHGPVFCFHGDADEVVPFASGKKLFEAANEPKEFVLHSGGHHNEGLPEHYHVALEAFLRRLPDTAAL